MLLREHLMVRVKRRPAVGDWRAPTAGAARNAPAATGVLTRPTTSVHRNRSADQAHDLAGLGHVALGVDLGDAQLGVPQHRLGRLQTETAPDLGRRGVAERGPVGVPGRRSDGRPPARA